MESGPRLCILRISWLSLKCSLEEQYWSPPFTHGGGLVGNWEQNSDLLSNQDAFCSSSWLPPAHWGASGNTLWNTRGVTGSVLAQWTQTMGSFLTSLGFNCLSFSSGGTAYGTGNFSDRNIHVTRKGGEWGDLESGHEWWTPGDKLIFLSPCVWNIHLLIEDETEPFSTWAHFLIHSFNFFLRGFN